MMNDAKDPLHRAIGIAVATAALTVLATKLVEWGVEELRSHYRPKKPDAKKPTET
jgi:hypothetical protein